jgi:hypothetical protein
LLAESGICLALSRPLAGIIRKQRLRAWRQGKSGRRAAWKKNLKNLKNSACQVVGASLGCALFLGKPFRAGSPDMAAAEENDDLWQLKFG